MIKYNHWLPKLISRRFPITAITLWPFILCSASEEDTDPLTINHEKIHLAQYRECYVVGFLFLYLLDYVRLRKVYPHEMAYLLIRFEQEAYDNCYNKDYLSTRKKRAWGDLPKRWKKYRE